MILFYIKLIIIQMIKGFSIIKFLLGGLLSGLIVYAVSLFISSWDQQSSVKRVISILIVLVTVAIMWFFQLPKQMFHYVLGINRYNKFRNLIYQKKKANQIPQIASNTQITLKQDQQIVKKSFKLQNKDIKFKKFHSLDQQLPLSFNKKRTEIIFPSKRFLVNQQKQKKEEKENLKKLYIKFIQELIKVYKFDIKIQNQKIIKKCHEIIGQIFQKQWKMQEQNITELVQHLESLYNIKIIDYRGHQKNQNKQSSKSKKLMTDKFQFSLDEILQNYQDLFVKFGYQLKNTGSEQIHEKSEKLRKIDKIEKAIKQRRRLDRYINLGSQFAKNTTRLQMIQRLKQVAQNGKKNEKIIPDFQSIDQIYEYTKFVIWVLTKHINKLVKNKFNQAAIYQTYVPELKCFYWCQQPTSFIVYYSISHAHRDPKFSMTYKTNPENNIVSLFYIYLQTLNRYDYLKNQLPQVPQLYSYVHDVCYNN